MDWLITSAREGDAPPVWPLVEHVDDDLTAARTVVEALAGTDRLHWAAGVVVTRGGREVVVTSDRGRGWAPAVAMLPAGVMLPWSHANADCWEGLLDPARVVIEYAEAVGGQLTAVASTYSVAVPDVAGVPWAYTEEGRLGGAHRAIGPALTRFELQVPQDLQHAVARIVEPVKQREQALWLAFSADDKAGSSDVRSRILTRCRSRLDLLSAPRWIASLPWEPLEVEYEDWCEQERAVRIDSSGVAVGQLDTAGGACRPFLLQMYAAEALLALRNPSPGHALTDAAYSWSMLIEIVEERQVLHRSSTIFV